MSAEMWTNYEKNKEEVHSTERGPITSQLEITNQEIQAIEEKLGFSLDNAFDEYKDAESSDLVGGNTHAATGTQNEKVTLEAFRDAPITSLAHEAVHGMIRQPQAISDLPGDNPWNQTLYEEFVAQKAESYFKEISTNELELRKLSRSKKTYEEARKEHSTHFPEEKLDLNQEIPYIEAIEDEQTNQELYQKATAYKKDRETILAKEAAHRHQEDIEIEKLVNPDKDTYQKTLKYIKNIEEQIADKYTL